VSTSTLAQAGLAGLPGPARGALSFAVVLVVGVGLLSLRPATVERAVDRAAEGSPLAVVYGVVAFGLVALVGSYGLSQGARVGVDAATLRLVGTLVVGLALSALGAFGYLVVGTLLTQIEGARRPWLGAAVGAVVSALPWLALPALPALAVWTLVAAVGLGGPTRHYVHAERTVETEAG
jgi:hypothetical protein